MPMGRVKSIQLIRGILRLNRLKIRVSSGDKISIPINDAERSKRAYSPILKVLRYSIVGMDRS
jgi:hypothetical protein